MHTLRQSIQESLCVQLAFFMGTYFPNMCSYNLVISDYAFTILGPQDQELGVFNVVQEGF